MGSISYLSIRPDVMLPTTVWNTMLPMLSGTNVISRTTVWSSITPTNTGISRSLCIALNNYQINLQYFVYMELKNFQMFNVHNYINSTFLLYQLNSFGSNMILFCFMFFKVFFRNFLYLNTGIRYVCIPSIIYCHVHVHVYSDSLYRIYSNYLKMYM